MSGLIAIFAHEFMLYALIAGLITGITAPLTGVFLVARRSSFLAETLAHVSLAGVAVGYLTNTQPIGAAIVVAVLTALLVEYLRAQRRVLGEAGLSMVLSGGLALAAVLLSAARGLNVNLGSILFGSITTVTQDDLFIIGSLGLFTVVLVSVLWKELLSLAIDEELAEAAGIRALLVNRLFVSLCAVTVALSMRIVGILLIGALMIIPVIAATQWDLSFRRTTVLAVVFSLASVLGGLLLSYKAGLSSGGTIVLVAIAFFLISAFLRPIVHRRLSATAKR
jgi:zinc transport system permease protein